MSALALEPAFEIELWEQAVESHPCMAMLGGMVRCEHEAAFTADLCCTGCHDVMRCAYLCDKHMVDAKKGNVILHLIPCGMIGFKASVITSRRITA